MSDNILTPISPGELIDKITILRIKAKEIKDPVKVKNVQVELGFLNEVRNRDVADSAEMRALDQALQDVNQELWIIEDDIRDCERGGDFGETFIKLARAVYVTNDRRADLKKQINLLLGSMIVEEKSYSEY
jgi:hypothetical protein